MLMVWAFAILAFVVLPFQLEYRTMSLYGMAILGLFILAFCLGAFAQSPVMAQREWTAARLPDFTYADRILKVAAAFAIVAFAFEMARTNVFDLAAQYLERSDRATALINGQASESSIAFQIGFLFYPASFIYIVRELAFRQKPDLRRLVVFGGLPVLMATLSLGGRSALLYAFVAGMLALRLRRIIWPRREGRRGGLSAGDVGIRIVLAVGGLAALNYFATVFIVRAAAVGGIGAMFDLAANSWGVSFDGAGATALFGLLGEGNGYLLFVFTWYLVQGIVISNSLFTDYTGPLNYGIYGIDLAAALARRVDGDFVSTRFLGLLDMNVVGFFPSAFGSMFVDFGWYSLMLAVVWGALAARVYRKIREAEDPRYLLWAPFVSIGIFFSLINTPIGFSNGLMTHIWAGVVFFLLRSVPPNEALLRDSLRN